MRILLLIICISGLLAKDVASVSWEIWYLANRQEISNTKCVNKAKPMLHCNGKCYLAKQLKKLELKQQSPDKKSNPYGHSLKMDWIATTTALPYFPAVESPENKLIASFSESLRIVYLSNIFHPPIELT
jgi:hypothetical protein